MVAMTGMERMFKMLGVDTAAIQKAIAEPVGQIGQVVLDLKAQMNRIEMKLDAILENDNGQQQSGSSKRQIGHERFPGA
jgi:hypothetical protein